MFSKEPFIIKAKYARDMMIIKNTGKKSSLSYNQVGYQHYIQFTADVQKQKSRIL